MRIIFIGAVQFSEKAVTKLIDINANVVGICTLEKSSFNTDHVDLTPLCLKHNIPVKYTTDINSKENINWIKELTPDIIFCLGWSRLIKSELLELPPIGVIGYHPTALPANRGRHPLIWTLVLGLEKTASTFFFMDEGVDSGDILSQRQIAILKSDNAGTLYRRITETALQQIEELVPALQSGIYQRFPQDNAKANYWRKRQEKDGVIDWRMAANSINNLVQGLTEPYAGAHFVHDGDTIKVWDTEVVVNSETYIEPGKVLLADSAGIIVKTGEDSILLKKIDPILEIKIGSYL